MTKKQNTDFGIVLTLVLLVTGLIFDIPVLIKIAVVALLMTALLPVFYTPFAWLWFKFAQFLERFFSGIILSVIFYLLVTPVGLIRRFFAKDTMRLRDFKKNKNSVFVESNKIYAPKDIEHQF